MHGPSVLIPVYIYIYITHTYIMYIYIYIYIVLYHNIVHILIFHIHMYVYIPNFSSNDLHLWPPPHTFFSVCVCFDVRRRKRKELHEVQKSQALGTYDHHGCYSPEKERMSPEKSMVQKDLPSWELTYPTLGKGKSSPKCHFLGIC